MTLSFVVVCLIGIVVSSAVGTQVGKVAVTITLGPTEQFPRVVKIREGECVLWRNTGKGVHVVQQTDNEFDSGFLNPGDEFKRCFEVAGVVQYQDGIAPRQQSIIVVGPFNVTFTSSNEAHINNNNITREDLFFFFFLIIFFSLFSLSLNNFFNVFFFLSLR